jgi:hypothetical protein
MACTIAGRTAAPLGRIRASAPRRRFVLPPRASLGRPGNAAFNTPWPGASFSSTPGHSSAAAGRPAASSSEAGGSVGSGGAPALPRLADKQPSGKARLPSLDSLRFFLIAYVAVGHFVAFATTNPFLLRLLTQVNVWVGPFFVLSGYVAGYTATEIGKYQASPRIKPAGAYTVTRVAGFYPLFALVQVGGGVGGCGGPAACTASLLLCWGSGRHEGWRLLVLVGGAVQLHGSLCGSYTVAWHACTHTLPL